MLIAADEQIPGVRDLFGDLGEVRPFAGRVVTASDVADADALLVRSVTRVDERLLSTSIVRFVGTTTSGTDHVDTAYLASRGITFADAAGSNARPVAEYVLTAILLLADRCGFDPRDKTLGVVGVGRIGSIVADWAELLGMTVLRSDPPLAEEPEEPQADEPRAFPARRDAAVRTQAPSTSANAPPDRIDWTAPAQLLAASDIVTLHVPLTEGGQHPTAGMVDAAWLGAMRPGAFLINTSRGAVAIEPALLDAMDAGRLGGAILDVWLNEPRIDASLAARCEIATPHIAGQSFEAKRRAAAMIRAALAAWCHGQGEFAGGSTDRADASPPRSTPHQSPRRSTPHQSPGRSAAQPWVRPPIHAAMSQMRNNSGTNPAFRDMLDVMLTSCDLAKIDVRLRSTIGRGAGAEAFDAIRSQCGARHEFTSHAIDTASLAPAAASFLRKLGFPPSQ